MSVLVLDGATGTELGRLGCDLALPLWSARALVEAPDLVERVHRSYFESGAAAVITNTFRTHRRSLAKAGLAGDARRLTLRAVELARSARDAVRPDGLVLGGVAPLEDCYRADLVPDAAACSHEHAEMIGHLVEGGVDLVLIETMGHPVEALEAAASAERLAPGRWIISFCPVSGAPPGLLRDGSSLVDLLPKLLGARAVGVNCVAAPETLAHVRLLRALLPGDVGVIAYANVGQATSDDNWFDTDAVDPERYAEYAETWAEAGATMIGGCCGTTPETIRAVARRFA